MKWKMITALLLFPILLLGATGCAETRAANQAESTEQNGDKTGDKSSVSMRGKGIIVYYSYSGQTKRVAEHLAKLSGADVYEIHVARPYPADPYETATISKEERRTGNLPRIQEDFPDIAPYDCIFLGGPIWNARIATPLAAYLQQNSLQNKQIKPFWTSQGSGDTGYMEDLKARMQNAGATGRELGIAYPGNLSDEELEQKLLAWLGR